MPPFWLLPIALWGCLAIATDGVGFSNSGILGPKYDEIIKGLVRLESEYPSLAQRIIYGKSARGRNLQLLWIRKQSEAKPSPTIVILGNTHGREYLNIEDRLPEEFLKRAGGENPVAKFLNSGGNFVMVPVTNPDGYEARTRENANGVDLNRDWSAPPAAQIGFKESESRTLADQLDRFARAPFNLNYRVLVDYHCCIGAVLHPWSHLKEENEALGHSLIGKLAQRFLAVDYGTTSKLLGYTPMGTMKDYFFQRYGALSFTYEGRQNKEHELLAQHLEWWDAVLSSITGGSRTAQK